MSPETTFSPLSRRALLGAAAGGIAASAGCLGSTERTRKTPNGTPASDSSWPQLGQTGGHAGYNTSLKSETDPPTPAWQKEVEGPVTTPTAVDDTVYLTRGAPTQHGLQAIVEAYALADGTRRWSLPLTEDDTPVTFRFTAPNSNLRPVYSLGTLYVSLGDRITAIDVTDQTRIWTSKQYETLAFPAPPTLGTDGVYAGGLDSLVALDHDGSQRWAYPSIPEQGNAASDATKGPGHIRLGAVTDDRVYVSAGHQIIALTVADGTVAWKRSPDRPHSLMIVASDGSLVRAGFGGVEARDFEGNRQWRSEWPGKATIRPAVADGTVFVAGLEGTVAAYDLASGDRQWTRSLPFTEWAQGTVPTVTDGGVHLLRLSPEQRVVRVYSLARDSGETQWQIQTDATRARGPIPASGRYLFTAERTPEKQHETSTMSAGQDTTTTIWAYEPSG